MPRVRFGGLCGFVVRVQPLEETVEGARRVERHLRHCGFQIRENRFALEVERRQPLLKRLVAPLQSFELDAVFNPLAAGFLLHLSPEIDNPRRKQVGPHLKAWV